MRITSKFKSRLNSLPENINNLFILMLVISGIFSVIYRDLVWSALWMIIYSLAMGILTLLLGKYYRPAGRTPEKVYTGLEAQLIGIAHIIISIILIYYFW